MSSIAQVSADACGNDKAFSCYILPDHPTSQQSTDITGIGTYRQGGQTVLTVNCKPLASSTLREGMELFLNFLPQFLKVLLVAHKVAQWQGFLKVLIHQACHYHLEAKLVTRFADNQLGFRHHLKGQVPKFTLGAQNSHFKGSEFDVHNAAGTHQCTLAYYDEAPG